MHKSFPVVFALYPKVTQLDFTGPLEILSRLPGAQCVLASTSGGTIEAEGGVRFADVVRLADVTQCALLCVPGGFGSVVAIEDREFLAELRRLAGMAQFVTSVCTGSLLLGAAGLLHGKRAACHWAWREDLRAFGAIPDAGRVVCDGNIFTGGGVTAGIDMALTVMASIAGPTYAQTVQLAIEYAPAPPFDSERPETARPEVVRLARQHFEAIRSEREAAIQRASAALARGSYAAVRAVDQASTEA